MNSWRFKVKYLDTHALDIVQAVNQTLNISSMAELRAVNVLLEECAVGVVVGWVSIDPTIQKQRVEWEPPILWRWHILVSLPFSPIVERVVCRGIGVEVVFLLVGGVTKRL